MVALLSKNKKASFTLLELLISLAIIGLVSSIFSVKIYRQLQKKQTEQKLSEVIYDLQLAQSISLTYAADVYVDIVPCADGISLSRYSYQIDPPNKTLFFQNKLLENIYIDKAKTLHFHPQNLKAKTQFFLYSENEIYELILDPKNEKDIALKKGKRLNQK